MQGATVSGISARTAGATERPHRVDQSSSSSSSPPGRTLVIADMAAVRTVRVPDFAVALEFFVSETCASGVMLSGSRFVCGPANDWDRVFYTYDVTTGTRIAQSAKYTYKGIPMRSVPGRNEFVTVTTDSSPSDFFLHRASDDGKVSFVNDSPYHGDFGVSLSFAFHRSTDHLIQETGLLLKIHGPTCGTQYPSGCFEKDGTLGTLATGERFLSMTDDGVDSVYGIVTSSTGSSFDAPCASAAPCSVQKVDVPTRVIASKKSHVLPSFKRAVGLRHDAACNRLVFAYAKVSPTESWKELGYSVATLDYVP